MKANLQSISQTFDHVKATGTWAHICKFSYPAWTPMADYVLEYVAEPGARFDDARREPGSASESAALPAAKQPDAVSLDARAACSPNRADAVLTPRQREVFDLIVQGMSNKEIARSLQLAEGTVKIHIKALFAKLGVHRRAAVAVAGTRLLSSAERASC